MASLLLCVVFTVALGVLRAEAKYIEYNTSHSVVPGKLNVHLVPHTHDDVGWLKTVDQYYVGSNNSIQGACVRNVLDSVIPALLADKNRKFIYVEQAFFQRWWRDQSRAVQKIVRALVATGQLEFINGGMCMHDEATTHYIDMIDQTTLGHRFLSEEFNVIPRIGWQIDPFGHSAVQAYLLGSEVGFDALFFARIDYQDRAKRKNERSLEVVWQGSKSLGSSAQIFAGAFPDHYDPPDGFYFEVNDESPIVQDDVDLFDYNVQDRVNDFVTTAISQANVTRTNHVMWTMGTDFKYQYAHTWFLQMDKLIHYVNQDGRVNALYSTPSMYTDAKYASGASWPLKMGDFFPYADHVNAYWTGYFTSRPSLKRYVRVMSGYYLAARQLEFFKGRSKPNPNTDSLAEALATAQHHDAVSGTEKQHVANDYAKRLAIGCTEAERLVGSALACLVESACSTDCRKTIAKFKQCPLLNISYCPASEIDLSRGNNLIVVAYNSLAWERSDIIMIPVVDRDIVVYDSEGRMIESQILPLTDSKLDIRDFYVKAYLGKHPDLKAMHRLAFMVTLPPLGFHTYKISSVKKPGTGSTESSVYTIHEGEVSSFEVGHVNLRLTFSPDAGKFTKYTDNTLLVNEPLDFSYAYYAGANKTEKDPQASGAYIFRPNGTSQITASKAHLSIVRGPVIDEVHQQINQWIHQITRLYNGKEHVEIEFAVGPIPFDDGVGKEVVTQITTAMLTNRTFYTDSNGRDFIKRIRDYRFDWGLQVNEPVSGNYYPINLGIYVKDHKNELSVLVDRSTGGSSIKDGQIELMLHRRLLHDDSRGVDEALNETVCIPSGCAGLTAQGKFYLRIDPVGKGAKWRRTLGQEIYAPILLAFAEEEEGGDWMSSHVPTFSATDLYNLPDNVALITLQELPNGSTLLRLAHLYEAGEDKELSVMSRVQLRRLFPKRKIIKVREMSLSANQERGEMENKRLVWKVEGSHEGGSRVVRGRPLDLEELVVELAPMEIRTFIIEFEPKTLKCS